MSDSEARLITVTGARQEQFANYEEVARYLGQRVATRFAVSEPLGLPLTAVLEGAHWEDQTVTLKSGETEVTLPRRSSDMDEGISVSTSPEPLLDIIAHPLEWDDPFLDRGLGWVRVSPDNPDIARVHLTVVPEHGMAEAGAAERLSIAVTRIRELVDAALAGSAELPWVDHSAYSEQVIERQQAAQRAEWETRRQRALSN